MHPNANKNYETLFFISFLHRECSSISRVICADRRVNVGLGGGFEKKRFALVGGPPQDLDPDSAIRSYYRGKLSVTTATKLILT